MGKLRINASVPLAPHTTLRLGGPAEWFTSVRTSAELREAVEWARGRGEPVTILGGGSNALIPDDGVRGLVISIGMRGLQLGAGGTCTVQAGEEWDAVVASAVDAEFGGIECLSGIPGRAGATPMQNVGAYGQQVADTISRVTAFHVRTSELRTWSNDDCAFGYRTSAFRALGNPWIITEVEFQLYPNSSPMLAYPELKRVAAEQLGGSTLSLASVRELVIQLRRSKAMVVSSDDVDSQSVGSFFVNPVISARAFEELVELCRDRGLISSNDTAPSFPTEQPGFVKVPAAWLIERAGIRKGERHGAVGVSSKHVLALVHYGGGTTEQLLQLSYSVASRVRSTFAIELQREPQWISDTSMATVD